MQHAYNFNFSSEFCPILTIMIKITLLTKSLNSELPFYMEIQIITV